MMGHAQREGVREDHKDLLPQDIVCRAKRVPGDAQAEDLHYLPVHRLVNHDMSAAQNRGLSGKASSRSGKVSSRGQS